MILMMRIVEQRTHKSLFLNGSCVVIVVEYDWYGKYLMGQHSCVCQ